MPFEGRYVVKNPKKYVGKNIDNIQFKSSWELQMLKQLDLDPRVLEFSYESIILKYYNPVKQSYSRYYVDFYFKIQKSSGEIVKYLVEVKPKKQTLPPKEPKRKSKNYIKECQTYAINMEKWRVAEQFAQTNGMKWQIITEKELKR